MRFGIVQDWMGMSANLFISNANMKHPSKYPSQTWQHPRQCLRPWGPKWQGTPRVQDGKGLGFIMMYQYLP